MELLGRREAILAEHERAMARRGSEVGGRSLAVVLESVLEEENGALPCLACHV